MSKFGDFLYDMGVVLGDAGLRWTCVNCGDSSRDYTGNLVDGTAKCPNCGMNPVIPGCRPADDEPSESPSPSDPPASLSEGGYDVSSSTAAVSSIVDYGKLNDVKYQQWTNVTLWLCFLKLNGL